MLCDRLRGLLEQGDTNAPRDSDLVVCDVGGLTDQDGAAVDGLARLQLTARRLGREVRLCHASDELHSLLALVGLCDVVGPSDVVGMCDGQADAAQSSRD